MRKVFKWINILFSIGLLFIALGVVYIAVPYFGNQSLIVRSGSMSPAIDAGSIVVIMSKAELVTPQANKVPLYNKGDIIAFRSENNSKTIITHRVVSAEAGKNGVFYKTKGDANKSVDGWIVNEQNILGKTFFTLPMFGWLLAFTKSNTGFPLLIIFPAVLVILLELRSIYKEFRKQKRIFQVQVPTGVNMTSLKVLLPIFITIFVFESTFAIYSDSEISSNNTFTAAEVFPSLTPTPTPTPDLSGIADHIVISEIAYDQVEEDTFSFIELYNPKSTDEDISGWKIVGINGSNGADYVTTTVPSETILPSHKYYLVGQGSLPNSITADLTFSTTLQNSPDAVALRKSDDSVVDALGYGFGGEGTFFTDVTAGHSIERKALSVSTAITMSSGGSDELKGNGYDTDNNINDFIDRTVPDPQNSGSVTEMP